MTEWGQKSKPPNFTAPKLIPQKILYRAAHQQYYSVKIKPTEKILTKCFLSQKNPGIENFKPKKFFYHRHHLKSEVPPLGFRSTLNFLFESFAYHVLHNRKTDCRIRSRIRETYKSKGKNHEWEKNQVSSIFWKPKYTVNWKTKRPQPRWKGLQ